MYCGGRCRKGGFTRLNKIRYRCLVCKKSFIHKKVLPSTWKDFIDFQKLIKGKSNRESIFTDKQISRPTLSIRFKPFFDLPLPPEIVWQILPLKLLSSNLPWVYGTDGKWLHRNGVIINHRDITNKENIWWSVHGGETHDSYHQDLIMLSKIIGDAHIPVGAISDWNGGAVAGVASNFGQISHQRCLVHVQRTAKSLLPEKSATKAVRDLRMISMQITHLKDELDIWNWQSLLVDWEKVNSGLLKIKTIGINTKKKWWYTHGDLRRAWRLLTKDQNPFFIYLTNSKVPKTNNALEGVNSNVKQKLGDHRGMKFNQQVSFVFWHFTFCRAKNKIDINKLWVSWKKLYNSKKAH